MKFPKLLYCSHFLSKFGMNGYFEKFIPVLFNINVEGKNKCLSGRMHTFTDEINSNSEVSECMFLLQKSIYLCSSMHSITAYSKPMKPINAYSSLPPNRTSVLNAMVVALENYIEMENVELAIDELEKLKRGEIRCLPVKTVTKLIDLCLEKDLLKNLSSNVHVMNYIIDNCKILLKPLLEKYAAAGHIEKLNSIRTFMPDFTFKIIEFNTYFVKALIARNKPEDLLIFLEERCGQNLLISVAAFEELVKFPEFRNRTIKLATKYLATNFYVPFAVIWAHFFTEEMYCEADSLLEMLPKDHSCVIEKIDRKVLKIIRKNENIFMANKFLTLINQMDLRNRVKERVYGTILEVLVLKAKYEDAVALVLEAEKHHLELNKHYKGTLLALKEALEKNNIPIPFVISS